VNEQGKLRLQSEINVVPYIDVMLVLLITHHDPARRYCAGIAVDLPARPPRRSIRRHNSRSCSASTAKVSTT
jgi:biopolymer transport protein ExbD